MIGFGVVYSRFEVVLRLILTRIAVSLIWQYGGRLKAKKGHSKHGRDRISSTIAYFYFTDQSLQARQPLEISNYIKVLLKPS